MNAKTQVETAEKVGLYPFDPTFWAQKANMEVKIQAQVERRGSPRQWHTGKDSSRVAKPSGVSRRNKPTHLCICSGYTASHEENKQPRAPSTTLLNFHSLKPPGENKKQQ